MDNWLSPTHEGLHDVLVEGVLVSFDSGPGSTIVIIVLISSPVHYMSKLAQVAHNLGLHHRSFRDTCDRTWK